MKVKKKRYFVSYSFIERGFIKMDNCSININEEKIVLEDIEEAIKSQKGFESVKVLFFVELKDNEILEKE